MTLSSFIFSRRYLISLFFLALTIIGAYLWKEIPLELSPNEQLPSVTISYQWGRTPPVLMEKEITRLVESAVNELKDIEKLESTTSEGSSSITVTFRKYANIDARIIELREKLHQLKSVLPPAVGFPSVSRRVPKELESLQTFMIYSLAGNKSPFDLREWARKYIQFPLSGLSGIAEISISGVTDPAIIVEFDIRLIEQYKLSIPLIMQKIQEQLQWTSAGSMDIQDERLAILFPPKSASINDIENLLVADFPTRIKLNNISKVKLADFPSRYIRRVNGQSSISIEIVKEKGADVLKLSDVIRQKLEDIKSKLPESSALILVTDASVQLKNELSGLHHQSMISVIIIFIVLWIFIRRLRAPIIILLTIVFSTVLALSGLYILGYTINIITLAALTISFGMVVDNAVVVYEHLEPSIQKERSLRISVVSESIKKILLPVITATLTTIGIFIPLMFALPELAMFLKPMGITLSLCLIASVFISFTWIPYSMIWLVKYQKIQELSQTQEYGFISLRKTLLFFKWKQKYGKILWILIVLLIGLPLYLIPTKDQPKEDASFTDEALYYASEINQLITPWVGGIGYQFYKSTYFGEPWKWKVPTTLSIIIRTPQGTPIEELNKIAANFEQIINPYHEFIEYYTTDLSESYGAYLQIYFKEDKVNQWEPYQLKSESIFLAARTGNSTISVYGLSPEGYSSGGGQSFSFHIQAFGYAYEELEELIQRLKVKLEENRRVKNVDASRSRFWSRSDLMTYTLTMSPHEMLSRDLTRQEVMQTIGNEINPQNIYGKVEMNGLRPYLIASSNSTYQYLEEFIGKTFQHEKSNFSVNSFGEIKKEKAISTIERENQQYSRLISFDYLGPYQFGDKYTKKVLSEFPLPVGFSLDYGFSFFDQTEKKTNMMLVFILSVITVWMIISACLENMRIAFIIMGIIPMGFLGIMCGSMFHGLTFGRGAMAGTLLLTGILVNNSILIYHGKIRWDKLGVSGLRSWMYIIREKYRPILVTTLTTVGGLIPLTMSSNTDFWQPMALVTIWGLLFSTLLLFLFMGTKRNRK